MVFSLTLCAQVGDFDGTSFVKADSIAALYPGHSLNDVKLLADKLTGSLTRDEEKFRTIYKWVCDNISNDYSLFSKHTRQRERLKPDEFKAWNRKFSGDVIRILIDEHRTVCSGYALLVRELAKHAGLECRIVDGYGRSVQSNVGGSGVVNHSWNAVRLNNKWYLCDPAWSSGVINGMTKTFVKKYTDVYFLPEPSYFIRNHYPLDSAMKLTDEKLTLNEFLNRPLIYVGAYKHRIAPAAPEQFIIATSKGKVTTFFVQQEGSSHPDRVALFVDGERKTAAVEPTENRSGVAGYLIEYTFKAKGRFAVHIAFDGDYVFSYEAHVN